VYRAFLSVDKSALKMTDTLKNSLIIAKGIRIISVNLIITAITFSEKKVQALLSYRPLHSSLFLCLDYIILLLQEVAMKQTGQLLSVLCL
jgi:hypothetical protein